MLATDKLKNVKVIGTICKGLITFDKRLRKILLSKGKQYITDVNKK